MRNCFLNCAADFLLVLGDNLEIFSDKTNAVMIPIIAFIKDSVAVA